MSLVVFTGAVGFALAPAPMDWMKLLTTLSAMAGGAGACGALNMWWDADIDANMARTAMRPIPRGVVPPLQALAIGILLSVVSVAALAIKVNVLAAALLVLTIAIYIPLYTMVLKRSTPMNIVIGGAAGALPPLIGWAAAVNSVSAGPIAMFLIIFLWTPPHFWALALCRSGDYERVGVPMLPNVVGPVKTCRQIVAYSILLVLSVAWTDADPGRRPPLRRCRRCGERGIPLARIRPLPPARWRGIGPAQGGDGPVRLLDSLLVRPVRGDARRGHAARTRLNLAAQMRLSPEGEAGTRAPPNEVNMADLDPNVRRRNWIVLVVLVAVAAAVYFSFVLRMMRHG